MFKPIIAVVLEVYTLSALISSLLSTNLHEMKAQKRHQK